MLQKSRILGNSIYRTFNQCRPLLFCSNNEELVRKRWAGHSKWQNIRHTKEANDAQKSAIHSKFVRDVTIAIRYGGGPDPVSNLKLKRVLHDAKKIPIPNQLIQNTMKRLSEAKEEMFSLPVRGPGNAMFIIEIMANKEAGAKFAIAHIVKKCLCRFDDSVLQEFAYRTSIICNPAKSLDEAINDAIEADVEEVVETEDKKFRFECPGERGSGCQKKLEELGYTIEETLYEYVPHRKFAINDLDLQICEKFVDRLGNEPDVVKIHDNID